MITYSGFVILFAGIIYDVGKNELPVIGLVGFSVAFITILYAFFGIRCPKCKGRWGYIAMYSGHPFAISKKFRFCPYCGIELDKDFLNSNDI